LAEESADIAMCAKETRHGRSKTGLALGTREVAECSESPRCSKPKVSFNLTEESADIVMSAKIPPSRMNRGLKASFDLFLEVFENQCYNSAR